MSRPELAEPQYLRKQPRSILEPPLPQNLDAERSVLGAVLLDETMPNATLKTAAKILNSGDFFAPRDSNKPQHGIIFRQMLALAEAGIPIDFVTLTSALRQKGELEDAGGAVYVSTLADGMPRSSNVAHYAKIVKETTVLRSLIYASDSIRRAAFDAAPVGEASTVARQAAETLAAIANTSAANNSVPEIDWRSMFHTFEDFEKAASLSFAIKGFLQNNGATLIGGLSGHGKTLVMLSVVKALFAGKGTKLWKYFEVMETAERVLYLIPESAIEPFKYRLQLFGLYDYLKDGRLLVRTLSKGPTPCLSDPRILFAAKASHVFLDTAVRFSTEGDENSAGDNQRGLASDIFALLGSGAHTVTGAHHSPKPFAKENVMRLENVLRGSGDIGAMVATAWGIKQVDATQNIVHIENVKPRDFQPPAPFQLIGRPFIDLEGDFTLYQAPGECGSLMEEQQPERDKGGARVQVREARAANIALLREWLSEDRNQTSEQLVTRFSNAGVKVSPSTVRKYKMELEQ